VVATRTFPYPPKQYSSLSSLPNAVVFSLKPLNAKECTQIVCKKMGVTRLPPYVESLIQKAEGNPLFAWKLVSNLKDSGVLEVDNGKCVLSASLEMIEEIPLFMKDFINSRIDRLPASAQMVLKVASVIGTEFQHRALKIVYPIEAEKSQIKIP